MISFIFETISLQAANFRLPDFGAFLWTLSQIKLYFSSA